MRNTFLLLGLALSAATYPFASATGAKTSFTKGTPDIRSMSALAFGPDGVLFVGDGKGGSVFALDLDDRAPYGAAEPLSVRDVEGKIGALLGTTADEVLIHDMAVNPVSQNVYFAVSRGRGKWGEGEWLLPNDVADASVLVKLGSGGELTAVSLENVSFTRAALPNPVSADRKHGWKEGISLRADTITDMSFQAGTLFVAGLSNEEFASTMWRVAYPFADGVAATTLENYHGAHGEYETEAPIRAFVPYVFNGKEHILAAYLCTPLVTFPLADLKDRAHVKGRTIGEFGAGNYPLDLVVYRKNGTDRFLIANSDLPFLIVDPKDVESFEGAITEPPGEYVAGVPHEYRSGSGIQHIDLLNAKHILALKRHPAGPLDVVSIPVEWF